MMKQARITTRPLTFASICLIAAMAHAATCHSADASNPSQTNVVIGSNITFTDLSGRVFKDVRVLSFEQGFLKVMTSEGISRIPSNLLPENLRLPENSNPQPAEPPEARPPPEVVSGRVALASLEAQLQRLRQELTSLQQSHDHYKVQYDTKYAEIQKRYRAQYRAEKQAYDEQGRSVHIPPIMGNPATHPDVVRLKGLVDGYATQTSDRKRWIADCEQRRDEAKDRIVQAEAAQQRAMMDKEVAQKAMELESSEKQQIAIREKVEAEQKREQQEKKSAFEKAKSEWGQRLRAVEEEIRRLTSSGEIKAAFLQFHEAAGDRRAWDRWDQEGTESLIDAGVQLFASARARGELSIAAGTLKAAIHCVGRSKSILGELATLYDEMRLACQNGDVAAVTARVGLLDIASDADPAGCALQRRELSATALDVAFGKFLKADFSGGFDAVDLAQDLWPENPKLRRVHTMTWIAYVAVFGAAVWLVIRFFIKRFERSHGGWLSK